MLYYGLEWQSLDSYFQFKEITAPDTPPTNEVRLYAKDSSSTSTLCYKNDAGTEVCLPTSGTILTGGGTDNQVAIWNGTAALDAFNATAGSVLFAGVGGILAQDNANLFWDDSNNRLGIGTAAPAVQFHVKKTGASGTGRLETDTAASYATLSLLSAAKEWQWSHSSNDGYIALWEDGSTPRIKFTAGGDTTLVPNGGNVIIGGGATASRLRLLEASGSGTNYTEFVVQPQAANITYTLPADDGDAGEQLQTDGAGNLTWEPASSNALLDGSAHTDTVAQGVTRGSLIYGNSTPKWDELVVGSAGAFLRNDATDVMWSTLILPNAATANRLVYATASNTYGESADLTYDGTDLAIASGKRFRMQGQNRIRYLNSCVLATDASNQSLNDATLTALVFDDADIFDTDTLHSTVTNNTRLTAAITGKYQVTGHADFAANNQDIEVLLLIQKNGTTNYTQQRFETPNTQTGATTDSIVNVTALVDMTAGDYVELLARYTLLSGGPLATLNVGTRTFGMEYVGE